MPEPAPDAPTLCWSTGRSKTTATWSPVRDQSWSQFVRWLCPEQPASKKEVLPYVGATLENGRRTIRTVEQRYFLTLDADYADELFPVDVAVELVGVPYLIHTTWRHSRLAHRYRLIIPLSRGVEPREYKELAWTVMNRLDGSRFDVTTAQAERFMWGPSSQNRSEYYWTSANPRAPYLPVDEWLDGYHGPSEAPAAGGQAGTPPTPRATGSGAHAALEPTDEDRERAQEILLQACDQVEHVLERDDFAGRNEAVFHLMPLLIRFCEAGALDEDTVLDALWTAARRVPADEPYQRSEFNASVRSAREYARKSGPTLPETTPTKMAQADFEDVDLEADLWGKTPRLKHIAVAADHMGRNRLTMLAMVLLRVLAEVPAGVHLPGVQDGGFGKRAVLNLGVALIGSSGQGKTSFIENSKALLGRELVENHPSTGQGLIQAYMGWDEKEQKNVLKDDPRGFFVVDEVEQLGALANDTGSTLFSEIRTMLTGGSTGSANATKERQRSLPAGTYNFQLAIGVQPTKAGILLDGSDAGTPQRFIWTQVTDPKTALHPDDRPEWPGELGWDDSFLWMFDFDKVVRYPDWLLRELKEHDYKVSKEGSDGGELSKYGHQNLLRLKVAAGVAFLHESTVIEDLHVEIADLVLAASKRTQLDCERAVVETAFLRKKAAQHSDERVREEVGKEKLARLVKNARASLIRKKGDWVTWHGGLRPRANDREEYGESLWEALLEMDDVECEEEHRGSQVRRKARIPDDTP
jgi:hypothetical protein